MTWQIEFIPSLPAPVLWAAAALSVLLALVLLWRSRRGALLRILALGLLLAALANPNLKQEDREQLANIAVVVVDNSASQTIAGRAERTRAIRAELAQALGGIHDLEVRWITSSHDGAGGGEETQLFTDLNRGLADVPPERLAGVVMITDGQVHDVPGAPDRLGLGAPVHALITGVPGEFDNRIEVVSAPRFGLVGTEQTAEIKVLGSGEGSAGKIATIRVKRENQPVETLTVPFGRVVPLAFPFPHAGSTLMEIELEAEPGELTLANNRAVLQAEGVRENLRVLLVSGEPHSGERTWRNLLRSDASVDLVHFTILRPPEKQDGTPINQLSLIAFPTRELFSEKLSEFDLIIFDRYQRRGVLPLIYLDNVARYVEQGGAVLVAAGADFGSSALSLFRTPLADVLPARPTGQVIERPYRPQVTGEGDRHPVTAALPGSAGTDGTPTWGRWFRLIETDAQDGTVLMTGPENAPLLVLDRRGEGRVAVLLSDHAWLWARGYEGGGPHADLLRRLAHWLMKEPDLEEEYLRASGDHRGLTIERRSMQDDVGEATVTGPSGETTSVALEAAGPGLWRQRLAVEEPGLYRVEMGALSAVALVGLANSREFAQVTASDAPLAPVLDATGGGRFWMGGTAGAEAAALPRIVMLKASSKLHGLQWLGLKDREAYLVRGIKYTPLFAGFLALAVALGLIGFTWFRESR